jgi:nucleoside 2-deoxyribosyltransferase
MKFYVIAGRNNREVARELALHLEEHGHECTFAWFERDNWEDGFSNPKMAAELDKMGIQMADAVVALLPGGPGSNWELGFAHAQKKPILLVDMMTAGRLFDPDEGNIFYYVDGAHRMILRPDENMKNMVEAWIERRELAPIYNLRAARQG